MKAITTQINYSMIYSQIQLIHTQLMLIDHWWTVPDSWPKSTIKCDRQNGGWVVFFSSSMYRKYPMQRVLNTSSMCYKYSFNFWFQRQSGHLLWHRLERHWEIINKMIRIYDHVYSAVKVGHTEVHVMATGTTSTRFICWVLLNCWQCWNIFDKYKLSWYTGVLRDEFEV